MSDPHTPVQVGPLRLRNRIVKAGTYEGMTPEGRVTDALIAHHAGFARHGVALTTVAYAAVEPDGRTFGRQLLLDDAAVAELRPLTDAVHAAGGAASLQLAHAGGFSKLRRRAHGAPAGPSCALNPYGVSAGWAWVRPMTEADLARVVAAFADGARRAEAAGFDAVELHVGHGYLLSQFLSPAVNRRRDGWGGDLAGRARLARAVTQAVRAAVGGRVAIVAKLNVDDGVPGGLGPSDAAQVAAWLADDGVDAVVPSGGLVDRSAFFLMRGGVPLAEMAAGQDDALARFGMAAFGRLLVRRVPYTSTFFLDGARRVRDAVSIPVFLLGGVDDAVQIRSALDEGFAGVVLGRALIAEPDLLARLGAGWRSACTRGNLCVAEMDRGGVRCVRHERRCDPSRVV